MAVTLARSLGDNRIRRGSSRLSAIPSPEKHKIPEGHKEGSMDLDAVVRRHREELKVGARAVEVSQEFNLTTPCVLVEDGTVVTTSLGGLRGYLPCSSALASEAIQRFVLLRSEHGFDRAFEMCSEDTEQGEEFVWAWDESQSDLSDGVVCTVDDLTAMVQQARDGWKSDPRRMLVVARNGQEVASGTVVVDWVLAG